MKTWFVDTLKQLAQECQTEEDHYQDRRFRVVFAQTEAEALENAQLAISALNKLDRIRAGEEVVMSDAELDCLIDLGEHPTNVVSIPNPRRVGILDAYVVGVISCPTIRKFRAERGL